MNLGVFASLDEDFQLELTSPIHLVGRALTCHIVLKDDTVGAEHCQLVFRNGLWSFRAVPEREVLLNGESTLQGQVMPGDRLTIGQHEYQIQYEAAES